MPAAPPASTLTACTKPRSRRWHLPVPAVGLAILLLVGLPSTFSFAVLPTKKQKSFPPSPLSALVFNEYGYSSSSSSPLDDYSSSTSSNGFSSSSSSDDNNLVSFLSESWSSSLARLACAFAPPGHEIHPSDLTSAQVLCVDDHHIEISAVICDTEACVTVAVPVDFPNECRYYYHDDDDDDDDNSYMTTTTTTNNNNNNNNQQKQLMDCVMDNLQQLDERATQLIRNQEWKHNHAEELQHEADILQTLKEPIQDKLDLPPWWVSLPTSTTTTSTLLPPPPPPQLQTMSYYHQQYNQYNPYNNNANNANNNSNNAEEMTAECQNVKDLLNEDDFRDDLVALATRTCTELYPLDTFQLLHTAVSMVGPAGMMIRTQLQLQLEEDDDDDHECGIGVGTSNSSSSSSSRMIVDLPVRFSRNVETVEDLRACVLGVVAV